MLGPSQGNSDNQWHIKKCVTCNCWTYAYNPAQNKFAVLLNNRLAFNNQGLLTHRLNSQFGTSEIEILEQQFIQLGEEYLKRI